MTEIIPAEIINRLTGKWAISWQAYAVSFPIAVLGAFGEVSKATEAPIELLIALLISLTIGILLGLDLLILDKTWFKSRDIQPVKPWKVILGGLTAGTIFSLGIALGKTYFGGDFFEGLGFQLVANSLLVIWWGSSMALVLSSREEYSQLRAQMIEDAIAVEMVKARGSVTEHRLRTSLNKRLSSEMSEARSVLHVALMKSNESDIQAKWKPIANELRGIANDFMRPLSKKLWDSAEAAFPKPSILKVSKYIVSKQPLRPLALSLVVTLLSVATLTKNFGQVTGLTVLAATIAFIWLLIPSANFLMRRHPKLHAVFFVSAIVAFQLFDTAAWLWAAGQASVSISNATLWVNVLASLILIMVTSGFGAYSKVSQADLELFRSEISRQELDVLVRNRIVATLAQDAARKLHGKFQTRLISCASAIERASATEDLELLNRALIEVNEIFDFAVLASEYETSSLAEQVAQVRNRWIGICDITVNIDSKFASMRSKTATDIADLLEEGVTNSVRHGRATQVDLSVEETVGGARISIRDNGMGLQNAVPGLGTELIRLISAGNFSYQLVDGQTALEVRVAIS